MTSQSPYVDAENETVRPDTHVDDVHEQYLSARAGTNLREEAVTVKGRATSWKAVREAFESYIWRQWKAAGTWRDEKDVDPSSHRFTEKASLDRYGRALGADRAAVRLWGEDLTTVHVVRRARAFGEHGQPQPPADHLSDLLKGNGNVNRAYKRHIREKHGLKYARLSVLEPHGNGYAHVHDALWIEDPDGVVSESDIYPALDSHLNAVPQAQPRNHGPSAVDVRHNPDLRRYPSDPEDVPPATALPRELTKHLGGLSFFEDGVEASENVPNVLQRDRGRIRFYALLWATARRQWRPDRGVFPRLVGASQAWYGGVDDDDGDGGAIPPEDISTSSGTPTVDVDARPVDFQPVNADNSLQS